jgi:hypothetical protein
VPRFSRHVLVNTVKLSISCSCDPSDYTVFFLEMSTLLIVLSLAVIMSALCFIIHVMLEVGRSIRLQFDEHHAQSSVM